MTAFWITFFFISAAYAAAGIYFLRLKDKWLITRLLMCLCCAIIPVLYILAVLRRVFNLF